MIVRSDRILKEELMASELLWKRAVRRGIESARREPRRCNFEQACDLSNFAIACFRRVIANGESLSEQELDRRMSLRRAELEALGQRLAATWRQVMVTVKE